MLMSCQIGGIGQCVFGSKFPFEADASQPDISRLRDASERHFKNQCTRQTEGEEGGAEATECGGGGLIITIGIISMDIYHYWANKK